MATIRTLAELRAEQQILQARKIYLEAEIKRDFEDIKEELEPLRILTKGAKKMLSSPDNTILGKSMGYVTDFIARNLVFRNAGLVTKLVLPFILKNTAANLVEDNKSKIVNGLANFVAKFIKKSPEQEIDENHYSNGHDRSLN